jgi:hypothetical protein
VLDTVNINLYTYKASATGRKWRQLGADTAAIAYVNTYGTQTVNGAKTFSSTVTGARFDPTSSTASGNGMYLAATNTLGFSTAGTEKIRITSNGDVGIGRNVPAYKLDIDGSIGVSWGERAFIMNYDSSYRQGLSFLSTTRILNIFSTGGTGDGGIITFSTRETAGSSATDYGTERLRITSAGNIGIGTDNPVSKLDVRGILSAAYFSGSEYPYNSKLGSSADASTSTIFAGSTSGYISIIDVAAGGATTNPNTIIMKTASDERMRITSNGEVQVAGTQDRGAYNLQVNGTGVWGEGAYVNGSDANIKENIVNLDSSLNIVNNLKPVVFNYINASVNNDTKHLGFIAQDVYQTLENIDYLGSIVRSDGETLSIAYSNLIPILTKAIQEQQALIKALEQRLLILENK